MRGGQVSIEYLMVMGFALLIVVPLFLIYYEQANRLGDETTGASIQRAAVQVAETADTVYYLGAPSRRTLTVDLPENIQGVALSGRSIVFTVSSSHGAYEQVAWSAANLTGSFSSVAGPHVLVIEALDNGWVNITEG